MNSVKTEFCVQEKKSTKKCVQKESKSNNVQRATGNVLTVGGGRK